MEGKGASRVRMFNQKPLRVDSVAVRGNERLKPLQDYRKYSSCTGFILTTYPSYEDGGVRKRIPSPLLTFYSIGDIDLRTEKTWLTTRFVLGMSVEDNALWILNGTQGEDEDEEEDEYSRCLYPFYIPKNALLTEK